MHENTYFYWLHKLRETTSAQIACLLAPNAAVPKSATGQARHYLKSQQKYLERYLMDGRLEISNNRVERSIKPFVIDRKSFLFANTPRGAGASAVMFSMIETAKENGLDPFKYLVYVFEKAPNLDIRNNLDMLRGLLMPWCVPDYIQSAKVVCSAV